MKYRSDFITNSSSASYIINKKGLSESKLNLIRLHIEYALMKKWVFKQPKNKSLGRGGKCGWPEAWDIKETETEIEVSTVMTNFDMKHYLQRTKIPFKIKYEDNI